MQNLAMIAESTLAKIHENITTKMILRKLLTEGHVSIEDAQFFGKLAHKVIYESSDLFIPDAKQIEESLTQIINESEGKVLVDPETGDQYIYDPTTGELLPASPDADAGMDSEEEPDEGDEGDEDNVDIDVDDNGDVDIDIDTDSEDVSACETKTESTEVKESTEAKELNENEELILNLINKIKEI